MEDTKVVPCRLCLNVVIADDSEELDAVEKNIMQELIPELNLDITYDPKICRSCNKTMIASYQFVSKSMDELLSNYVKTETDSLEGREKKCDFCRSSVDEGFVAEFNQQKEHFGEILEKCMPERFAICDKKLVPCTNCLEAFKKQFSFISTCLNTEAKIQQYCFTEGTNSEGKINLYKALQFILSSETKPIVAHFTAIDKKQDRNEGCNVVVKTEAVEIKSETYEREHAVKPCSSKIDEAKPSNISITLGRLAVDPNIDTKASATRFTPAIKEEMQNEDYNFILKTEDIEIKSEECEEEAIEQPCSSKANQGEILIQGAQSASLGAASIQVQQNTIQYMLVGGNTCLQPSISLLKPLAQRKRETIEIKNAAVKKQKVRVVQNPKSGKVLPSVLPGKRSIGIQVDSQDLVKKCSIGIQVASWEVNTRTVGVNATPSTSEKQVTCRPTVLNTGTTTGVISREKRIAFRPKILRRPRK